MRWRSILVLLAVVGTSAAVSGSGASGPDRRPVQDTLDVARARSVAAVRAMIGGRGAEPAESVFKDIRILRGLRAELIPVVMEQGFSKSLGVGCGHCHVTTDWSRPDSSTFAITREMYAMTRRINDELLAGTPGLKDRQPSVTCSTCHRGETLPATRIAPRVEPGRAP